VTLKSITTTSDIRCRYGNECKKCVLFFMRGVVQRYNHCTSRKDFASRKQIFVVPVYISDKSETRNKMSRLRSIYLYSKQSSTLKREQRKNSSILSLIVPVYILQNNTNAALTSASSIITIIFRAFHK
jgi:hypothetical protein